MVNSVVNSNLRKSACGFLRGNSRVIAALWLCLAFTAQVFAADAYLKAGKPDGISLLAPPPEAESAEQAADMATVKFACKNRTAAEEARAARHDGLSLFAFAPAIGSSFAPGKFPKTEELYAKVKKEIGDPINVAKEHWKRKRPYELDGTLAFGKPEKSASYPSGHSTRGMVYAAVLAEVFPEKREEIFVIGREIGWDRVVIGKHFPTDIQAGRVLAQAIFRELMASPDFQHDLAEAKEEAHAAAQQPVGQGH